jgi:tetratricopeptide (TPR) repeat protein
MKRKTLSLSISALIALAFALAFYSCAGGPPATVAPPPAELSAEELERLELDAIFSLLEKGRMDEALSRLSVLEEKNPLNRDYPLLHASVLMSMDRLDDARSLIKAELAEAADNLAALYILSEIERFAGNAAAQKSALDALIKADPAHADGQAALGDLLYNGKNYRGAEEAYRKALGREEAHVEALLGLARVQYRREDVKGALDTLDKAKAAAPGDPIVRLDRSRILYELGRYDECESELDEAVRLAPDSAWNYVERGRLYLDTGRLAQAEADFSRSIELNPDYFLPYVYRAGIREEAGKDMEALADYKLITTIYPEYWYAFESIGVLSYRQGLWKEAQAAFDKAAASSSAHPEYYIAAGLALMRGGEARAAKDYASKALPKINRERNPAEWLMLRLIFDQTDMSSELELRIAAEKSLDLKSSMLYYLGAYWLGRGRTELGAKYIRMSYDDNRLGTVARRLAEADLKRLE